MGIRRPLNESSENISNSETQNKYLHILVIDTIDHASETANDNQIKEDILNKGRKMITDETKSQQ